MKTVGIAELKAHLSEHLQAVRRGETLTVLDRREPIARIVPLHETAGGLVVRPPRGALHDIPLPGPTRSGRDADVVDDLMAERRERL
ncbi:type II toxin-antitoxin system prevent-host-death family antitoxin [Myxococcota bacterium]|nr:type II toxin-antitoxin system prevent-host-death family antitoxin [Myxococcota bacterium]